MELLNAAGIYGRWADWYSRGECTCLKPPSCLVAKLAPKPISDSQTSTFSASLHHKINLFDMVTSKGAPVKYQQVESAIVLPFSKDWNDDLRHQGKFKWFMFAVLFLFLLESTFPSPHRGSWLVLTFVYELILLGMPSAGMTWEPRYRLWGPQVKPKFFKDQLSTKMIYLTNNLETKEHQVRALAGALAPFERWVAIASATQTYFLHYHNPHPNSQSKKVVKLKFQ